MSPEDRETVADFLKAAKQMFADNMNVERVQQANKVFSIMAREWSGYNNRPTPENSAKTELEIEDQIMEDKTPNP